MSPRKRKFVDDGEQIPSPLSLVHRRDPSVTDSCNKENRQPLETAADTLLSSTNCGQISNVLQTAGFTPNTAKRRKTQRAVQERVEQLRLKQSMTETPLPSLSNVSDKDAFLLWALKKKPHLMERRTVREMIVLHEIAEEKGIIFNGRSSVEKGFQKLQQQRTPLHQLISTEDAREFAGLPMLGKRLSRFAPTRLFFDTPEDNQRCKGAYRGRDDSLFTYVTELRCKEIRDSSASEHAKDTFFQQTRSNFVASTEDHNVTVEVDDDSGKDVFVIRSKNCSTQVREDKVHNKFLISFSSFYLPFCKKGEEFVA